MIRICVFEKCKKNKELEIVDKKRAKKKLLPEPKKLD